MAEKLTTAERARLRTMQGGHITKSRKVLHVAHDDRGDILTTRATAPARGIPCDEIDLLPATARADPEM
jgi:hypothetical protein